MQERLLDWYRQNKRELPWRANRDPYRIWISETMLQQTTTTAVIPYFEKFLALFPTLRVLAESPTAKVVEAWAGLGYYSRARNVHKAAVALWARGGFPQSHTELGEYPGFGPYTSRSVASLAFDESVGVVDGNTIRVLSRVEGQDWEWWQGKVRLMIQARADSWVENVSSHEMNQALMELGRTICTPKSPSCLLCPLSKFCVSLKQGKVDSRPQAKPRRKRELWHWEPVVLLKKERVLIRVNQEIPFLRGQWLLPGSARQVKSKPKNFHYRHSITHHDIYVTMSTRVLKIVKEDKWVPLEEIRQYVPASLVQKALLHASTDRDRLQTSKSRAGRRSSRSNITRTDRRK
ncbi:MAG: A/G-specific adenine glycosylase [Bdellovibrionales bacterium]